MQDKSFLTSLIDNKISMEEIIALQRKGFFKCSEAYYLQSNYIDLFLNKISDFKQLVTFIQEMQEINESKIKFLKYLFTYCDQSYVKNLFNKNKLIYLLLKLWDTESNMQKLINIIEKKFDKTLLNNYEYNYLNRYLEYVYNLKWEPFFENERYTNLTTLLKEPRFHEYNFEELEPAMEEFIAQLEKEQKSVKRKQSNSAIDEPPAKKQTINLFTNSTTEENGIDYTLLESSCDCMHTPILPPLSPCASLTAASLESDLISPIETPRKKNTLNVPTSEHKKEQSTLTIKKTSSSLKTLAIKQPFIEPELMLKKSIELNKESAPFNPLELVNIELQEFSKSHFYTPFNFFEKLSEMDGEVIFNPLSL